MARLSNVPILGRTALASRIQQAAAEEGPSKKFPNLTGFLKFWRWVGPYIGDFFHKTVAYRTYPKGKTGIFDFTTVPKNAAPLKIAVVADWATGTVEADSVAQNMKASDPHYTLHLGDVYYMGEPAEIGQNFLGTVTNNYTGVSWPMGSLGSFVLMGNHEMYSGGHGYFESLLPRMGKLDSAHKVIDPQSASYFCLETPHWLVLGLDTGYHSGGVPLFGSVPIVNAIPAFNLDARFDDIMLDWLKRTVEVLTKKDVMKKPVLLLTHHQPLSSFDLAYKKPVKQLAELGFLRDREFVWLFGHEHRLMIYAEQTVADGLRAYPRCIGHGGMPVEVTKVRKPDPRILYYDPRQHPIDKDHPKTAVGYNGHVVLVFKDRGLTLEYRDIEENNLLLSETFTPDDSGALHYAVSKPANSPLISGQQTS